MRHERLRHEFVQYIPDGLEDGVLYVSIAFATAAHLCCCGCRTEVVTPLSPTDWRLIFDGESISLDPSIGNWSFRCRSHYWISRGKVRWARSWSQEEIDLGRTLDRHRKARHYEADLGIDVPGPVPSTTGHVPQEWQSGRHIWRRVKRWFR